MTKPLIYLAEPSRILAKVISSELEKQGYEVETFKDGYSLLKKITSSSPQLIISDNNLAEINGIELCKILKTGSSKDSIPFILISTDDSVFDFWISSIEANRVVLVANDNIDYLMEAVKGLLEHEYVEANTFFENDTLPDEKSEEIAESDTEEKSVKKSEDEILTSWIVNAMSKSSFFFNMSKNVIQLYSYVHDINSLVEHLFRLLYSACAFDGIVLVLDSQPAKVFMSGTEFFDVSVGDEFWNICQGKV